MNCFMFEAVSALAAHAVVEQSETGMSTGEIKFW